MGHCRRMYYRLTGNHEGSTISFCFRHFDLAMYSGFAIQIPAIFVRSQPSLRSSRRYGTIWLEVPVALRVGFLGCLNSMSCSIPSLTAAYYPSQNSKKALSSSSSLRRPHLGLSVQYLRRCPASCTRQSSSLHLYALQSGATTSLSRGHLIEDSRRRSYSYIPQTRRACCLRDICSALLASSPCNIAKLNLCNHPTRTPTSVRFRLGAPMRVLGTTLSLSMTSSPGLWSL
jgi:hypothetical protein